jgi:mono/diheme cytochrome c family protein
MEKFMRNTLLTIMTAAIAVGVVAAGLCGTSVVRAADRATVKVATLQASKTSPVSGKQMYGSYCAPCHGISGKGNGPVGVTLKTPPADLTVLSRNHGGKYPSGHVASVLELGVTVPSHGSAAMPVWGPILGKMDQANSEQTALRISNLSHYLETMQAR